MINYIVILCGGPWVGDVNLWLCSVSTNRFEMSERDRQHYFTESTCYHVLSMSVHTQQILPHTDCLFVCLPLGTVVTWHVCVCVCVRETERTVLILYGLVFIVVENSRVDVQIN